MDHHSLSFVMPTPTSPTRLPPLRFLRAMLAALGDEATYDVRRNPSLWLGFLLAIPIPVLTWAASAEIWLRLITLPAPVVWGALLGAAGRLSMIALERGDRLQAEVHRVADEQRATAVHLVREKDRRIVLEEERAGLVSELKLAQAIQATLLPHPIHRPNVEVIARSIPTHYIGGDYVHSQVVEDRWLYLVLLDVSGHGISAAMVVARLHGMVRRLTLTKQHPVQMLQRLNQSAQELLQHTYFFLTAVTARLDLRSGELIYASGGHPGQVLLRADGRIELLRTPNRLLGMDDDILSREEPAITTKLESGDSLVLFSDGLFEVLKDGAGEVLGEDGLYRRLKGLGGIAPSLLIGEVLQDLAEYQGSSSFEDDVSILVARYEGEANASANENKP
ncbi:MAG: PP2C family protein-serine/threonine phosphatase [Planctomycetota bacterium]|nr:PP2C family protein-serine/threonine phosphatase [Planctomycetota bacterium]